MLLLRLHGQINKLVNEWASEETVNKFRNLWLNISLGSSHLKPERNCPSLDWLLVSNLCSTNSLSGLIVAHAMCLRWHTKYAILHFIWYSVEKREYEQGHSWKSFGTWNQSLSTLHWVASGWNESRTPSRGACKLHILLETILINGFLRWH